MNAKVRDAELSSGTGLLILAAIAGVYFVASLIGALHGGSSKLARHAVIAGAASVGCLVVGLRRQRAFRAHRLAFQANVSSEDVLPDDWLHYLARAFDGEVLPVDARLGGALPGVIEQSGDEISAGWFERVAFQREGQALLAYESTMAKWRSQDRVGRRVYSDQTYLRVRGQSDTHHTAFVSVEDPSAVPPFDDRAAFLAALTFDGVDGEWLRQRIPPEALEILAARPLFIVRCHAQLVEVLWNAEVSPQLLSRFEDAVRLVLLLRRTLRGHESAPFR